MASVSPAQLGILLPRQHKPHPTSSHADSVFDCLPTCQISECSSVFGESKDFIRRGEVEPTGEGSLQILFEKLAIPTAPGSHEGHVDTSPWHTAVAVAFPWLLVGFRWKRDLTGATYLASQSHSCSRCSLWAHRRIIGETCVEVSRSLSWWPHWGKL